jgi:hypothetical protein
VTAIPFVDSYWVVPEKLLAGQYPGGQDDATTRRRVQSLIQAGITTIIDLTMPGDAYFTYYKVLPEEAREYETWVERVNFPILDYSVPTPERMKDILDLIDEKLAAGERVYVHCIGGRGRTGTVVGCYLVRHGASGEQALAQIEHLRKDTANWWKSSPESDAQVEFVKNWK